MVMLLAVWATMAQAQPVAMALEDGVATATAGGLKVFEYHFAADLPKPFVHPLNAPSGQPITMCSPPDHVHHRGLMFALGNVAFEGEEDRYVVFWGESGAPERLGHIIHVPGSERIEAPEGKPQRVVLRTRNEWRRLSDRTLMLSENRRITLYDVGGRYVLTWESELIAPTRDIVLGPTEGREVSYYGLGLRTPREMDGGAIFNANGKDGESNVLGDDARWCAYIGPTEPKRGFVMFDHPTNPRHPTGWFVMSAGFGYMTASIVCHEPLAVPIGKPLRLRYGVCAFDGAPTAEEVEAWYREWAALEP